MPCASHLIVDTVDSVHCSFFKPLSRLVMCTLSCLQFPVEKVFGKIVIPHSQNVTCPRHLIVVSVDSDSFHCPFFKPLPRLVMYTLSCFQLLGEKLLRNLVISDSQNVSCPSRLIVDTVDFFHYTLFSRGFLHFPG